MPTLFLAPHAAATRRAVWEHLAAQNALAPLDPPLVLTHAASHAAWREVAREGDTKTDAAPRLLSADAYFARAGANLARARVVSGADRLWILSGLLRRLAPRLGALEKVAGHPDFAREMATLIAALRRANLSEFPTSAHSAELNSILRVYDARLQSLGAFDFEAAPTRFPALVARNRAFSWPRALVVDDQLDLSPALQIGLSCLSERSEMVVASLVCPGGETENPALRGALDFWRELGADIVRVGDFQPPNARAASQVLGFATSAARPDVYLTVCHTPHDEMSRIAAHIRRQVEAGARPADFALVCADLSDYEATARTVFAAHGVPLDWPLETPLRCSPLIRAIVGAAASCRQKWNVHELHDIFGDGILQLQRDEKTLNPRRLRGAALAARHPSLDDVEATRSAFEHKIAQLTRHPGHDDERTRLRIENSLAGGDLELVAHFKTLCAAFGDRIGASAWQNRFLELIAALAGHWAETEGMAGEAARRDLGRLRDAIEGVVERARSWDDADEETLRAPAEWLHWLEREIETRPLLENLPTGGVGVGSVQAPLEARRETFFCGLSEGFWPISPSDGSLGAIGRDMQALLRSHESPPIARATHVLARAVGRGQLSLSYAMFIGGRETPPSPLLDDLSAAWPKGDWRTLEKEESQATRRAHLRYWHRYLQATPDFSSSEPDLAHLKTIATLRHERRAVELGVYDGVLGERGRQLMESWLQSQGGAALSGSTLEFYARCPLRYFFEHVLGARSEEVAGDDLDAREAGNLVHAITRSVFKEWQTPLRDEDFDAALAKLAAITERECGKMPLRPILKEAEYHRLMGADGRSGPLVRWLRLEISNGGGAWTCEMRPISQTAVPLELRSSGLEERFAIQIGGHAFKGFIDRLDMAPDGSQMAVLDYKTGDISSLPSWKNGDDGLHFQLAIYALGARHLTRHLPVPPRLAMAYLTLRRAKIARGIGQEGTLGRGCSGAKMLSDEAFESWLSDVGARAARIADLRANGVFNISLQSAKDAKCDSCGSKSLCSQNSNVQLHRAEQYRDSPFFYLPSVREWE